MRRSTDEPCTLPYCAYPSASDVGRHGLQPLPEHPPSVDFARVAPYRSRRYRAVSTARLTPQQTLETARVVAASFAQREPQCRHLRPAARPPSAPSGVRHADPFGSEDFGPWSMETPARTATCPPRTAAACSTSSTPPETRMCSGGNPALTSAA